MATIAEPGISPEENVSEPLRRLDRLVGPLSLVARTRRLPTVPGEARFPVHTAELGDLTQVLPAVATSTGGASTRGQIDGAGGALSSERAARVCIAEAVERYSSCASDRAELVWATARELGEEAIPLASVPRCSPTELAHPACPVLDVDLDAPQRWVEGVSLTEPGRPRWVPAVMVYLHFAPAARGERFWLPISTGCAAHSDLASALLGALLEVVERDAIALTWLQRLALPELVLDRVDDELRRSLERKQSTAVQTRFYDATTDLGIPTVYAVDLAPHSEKVAQLVMCATHADPARAVAKICRETASSRVALLVDRPLPDTPDGFVDVFHGATFMGRPERLPAYRFLLDTPRRRRLSEMPRLPADPAAALGVCVRALRSRGIEAVVVELTTREAREAGMRVVRVVIPALQPLSFAHRARYLAHPRLYQAPAAMGHPVSSEAAINPDPQPFA